ncbi:para-aminobenzoate synthase, (PABA), variant 2 [Naganishia albida]|nr:para-aminobenzoate synthase, (PABA), variant 2 [Naganishia albida]
MSAPSAVQSHPIQDIPPCPRTLILDFRDSYTANLLTLFSTLYPPKDISPLRHISQDAESQESKQPFTENIADKVVIVQADTLDIHTYLDLLKDREIDCVILSPGPGRADCEADVPNLMQIIEETRIPILGVCLGMQAIAVHSGAKIVNTPDLKHGHVIPVKHNGSSLFDCLPPTESSLETGKNTAAEKGTSGQVDVVAYNSLTVSWDGFPTDKLKVTAWHDVLASSHSTGPDDQRTIQAIEGVDRPVWGVQFHPESIASSHGADILRSFLYKTNTYHGNPLAFPPFSDRVRQLSPVYHDLDIDEPSRPKPQPQNGADEGDEDDQDAMLESIAETFESAGSRSNVDADEMFMQLLEKMDSPLGQVWLDGVSSRAPTTSSIAFPSFILTYSVSSRTITCHYPSSSGAGNSIAKASIQLESNANGDDDDFWNWFGRGHAALKRMNLLQGRRWKARQPSVYHASAEEEDRKPRWKGGWVGWWGYEMKAESLGGYTRPPKTVVEGEEPVDACWAWCNLLVQREQNGLWTARGILEVDRIRERSYDNPGLQSVPDMLPWLHNLGVTCGATRRDWQSWTDICRAILSHRTAIPKIIRPSSMPKFTSDMTAGEYMDGIQKCRQAIFAGDSYELTMTTQFRAPAKSDKSSTSSAAADALKLYLQLRQQNPAPYSTYLSFPTVETTVLSSSPERFLRISPGGRIEMKPIKGTRARATDDQVRQWCEQKDRHIGDALRNDGKERAENLMIVDLIRSDLQSCCTSHSVQVPKLIALETYETVHQLVTTVRGQLLDGISEVQAVKRSFPPGSMTGAPKLRSVQLLEQFEQHQPRGIYSGAMGYMSIDGAVDLSVVIRTIIIEKAASRSPTHRSELEGEGGTWEERSLTIGAGGAITWLSDPASEWEEVMTKVKSVVG